jgi:hypothetical protein
MQKLMKERVLRLSLIISLFCLFSEAKSQKRLKNREIYNFNAGDIIHTYYRSTFDNVSLWTKRDFIAKTYSQDGDTVTFIVYDSIYTLLAPYIFELSLNTDTLTYPHLDSFPSPNVHDSSLLDDCGTLQNRASYSIKPQGFPFTELYEDRYYEGLGRYFQREIDINSHFEFYALQYYKTKDKECGLKVGNLTISESEYFKTPIIFPNPAKDFIDIRNITSIQNYEIRNLLGEKLLFGYFGNPINVTELTPGVYFMTFISDHKSFTMKFLKCE